MRCNMVSLSCCALFLAVIIQVCSSHPVTLDQSEIVEIVPVNDKESADSQTDEQISERNKRTIEMLRQLFPGLAQTIDNKIEEFAKYLFRIVGRVVLQGGLFGGGGGSDEDARSLETSSGTSSSSSSSSSSGNRRVSITLPTFPPDLEGDDDDDDDDNNNTNDSNASASNNKPSIETTSEPSTPKPVESTQDNENELTHSESQQNEIRIPYDQQSIDQDAAASGGNGPEPVDDLSNVDIEDENRNKRLVNFGIGVGADASATSSGSGGGSGNFLFDIIRLVAGSGSSESADEQANSAVAVDGTVKAEGLTEGIPGPVTRLFVIANRGISNLVQDLILRLAQTSERLVNFKARLITSLI